MRLEAREVCLRRTSPDAPSGRLILESISASFQTSELTILAGSNGSGKSMLLRVLTGLEKLSSGEVRLDGKSYPQAYEDLGRRVGILFQNPDRQILGQTIEEELMFGLRIHEKDPFRRDETCKSSLQWAGLWERKDQSPESLSGGEAHRLALASVLSLGPDLLFLDEPFTGLDYESVKSLLRLILELRKEGKGVVVVTHQLDILLGRADRLMLMKQGRMVGDGIPERILPHVEDHGVRRPPGKIQEMCWL